MKLIGVLLAVAVVGAATAKAEDATTPQTTAVVESPPPGYPTDGRQSYNEVRKLELQRGVKRTRNALIATSAAFAVGMALVIPAFTSDNCFTNDLNNDLNCTRTGKALLGVGYPFLIVGFWGAIVSGIMLGVRKGKIRRLDERIAYESQAKFRWDPTRSKFVF